MAHWLLGEKRVLGEGVFGDDLAFDEVALNDFFEHFSGAGVIPDAFRINDGNGTARADAETIDFTAIDERFRVGKLKSFEPMFEKFPGGNGFLARSALGICLVGTKEDMPSIFYQTKFAGGHPQGVIHH